VAVDASVPADLVSEFEQHDCDEHRHTALHSDRWTAIQRLPRAS
jgi:hypothetical protein